MDKRVVQVHGGNGGDGCISFTKLFMNEFAGPDGGDGGNGGHVVFEVRPCVTLTFVKRYLTLTFCVTFVGDPSSKIFIPFTCNN